jgi:glyoxylase-like metal-dependent hydrolase (beta-lactamase superfamily II)
MLVVRSVAVGPFQENSYLAACSETGEALLVDPGGEVPRILALREPGGFAVKRIVLTHGHIDHVAGAAQAQDELKVPLELHPDDRDWLDVLPMQAEMFGLEEVRPPRVDGPLSDGERVTLGKLEGKILHTPGHTRGGCCLHFPEAKAVFVGDLLFAGSVGRTDLPGGDFGELLDSIRRVLFPLGDEVRFYPGHGPSGLLGDERRSNPFVGEGGGAGGPTGRFY